MVVKAVLAQKPHLTSHHLATHTRTQSNSSVSLMLRRALEMADLRTRVTYPTPCVLSDGSIRMPDGLVIASHDNIEVDVEMPPSRDLSPTYAAHACAKAT